jgi:hypothetical protein
MKALVGIVALSLCACASGGSVSAPRVAALAFAAAAERGDLAALHAMLPARSMRAERVGAFSERLASDRVELTALGRSVSQTLEQHGEVRADVALRDRGAVSVVDDTDGWRLEDPGIAPSVAANAAGISGARAAVRALHLALRRHGPGAWTRSLSARAQGNVLAEVAAIVEATEDPSALEYTSAPSIVRFRLPDARLLVVVYESGAWRIDGVRDAE